MEGALQIIRESAGEGVKVVGESAVEIKEKKVKWLSDTLEDDQLWTETRVCTSPVPRCYSLYLHMR